MWSTAGSRPVQRSQPTSGTPQPPAAQDEMFASGASRMPNGQAAFRFGNQGSILPQQPHVPPSSIDDFPPLNGTANGEPPSERSSNLMSTLGFAPPNGQGSGPVQPNRGNGLLNALSANSRTSEPRASPGDGAPGKVSVMDFRDQTADPRVGLTRPQDAKSPAAGEAKQASQGDAPSKAIAVSSGSETRTFAGAIGNSTAEKLNDDKESKAPEVVDPLAGMAEVDKWGIKGLRTLMNNFPDYHAMVVGMDPSSLGIDMNSQE
jgi:CCR4-NOT transcription complex subunit 2